MERFNTITGIIGRRGSGKSLFTLGSKYTSKESDKLLKLIGIISLYQAKKIKVLIIDTFDHPAYRKIPIMPMNKLATWQTGVYRILINPDYLPALIKILNTTPTMVNTCVIFEDAYKSIGGAISKPLKAFFGDTKQKNIDVFLMYWSFGQMPPDVFRFLDYIECFKTNDSPEVRRSYMPGYFEQAMNVYNEVKANKNQFYHKTIETGNS